MPLRTMRSQQSESDPFAAYLARWPADVRQALGALRATIRKAAPKAEEIMSYGIPSYRQDGMLVGFGAATRHCAFYVMSGSYLSGSGLDLAGLDTSKGTLRFTPDHPLPKALVIAIVRDRMRENAARMAAKGGAKKAAKNSARTSTKKRSSSIAKKAARKAVTRSSSSTAKRRSSRP
ncbi:MAG: DUF1801 domain-containing protein [Polyangiaceae bacterium]